MGVSDTVPEPLVSRCRSLASLHGCNPFVQPPKLQEKGAGQSATLAPQEQVEATGMEAAAQVHIAPTSGALNGLRGWRSDRLPDMAPVVDPLTGLQRHASGPLQERFRGLRQQGQLRKP